MKVLCPSKLPEGNSKMNYSSLAGAGRTQNENQAPSDQHLPLLQEQLSSRFLEEMLHLLIGSVAFQARVTAPPWAPSAAHKTLVLLQRQTPPWAKAG